MSMLGPVESSLIQAAQAQQVAGKARDRERAALERQRRLQDQLDLRVAGVEAADVVKRLPGNGSEQADEEQASGEGRREDATGGRIDLQV